MIRILTLLLFLLAPMATFAATVDMSVSWTGPDEREDNTKLPKDEISGYTLYYGSERGKYTNSIRIAGGTTSSHQFTAPHPGASNTYYLVITTRDTGGRESQYSKVVSRTFAPAPTDPVDPPTEPGNFVPFSMYGTDTPATQTFLFDAKKPANAINDATISITVFDPDFADEGELIINGNAPIKLFGPEGNNTKDGKTVTLTFKTPASIWKVGDNTITFKRLKTAGFKVDAMTVSFEVPEVVEPPKPPEPIAYYSYNADLSGARLLEGATLKKQIVYMFFDDPVLRSGMTFYCCKGTSGDAIGEDHNPAVNDTTVPLVYEADLSAYTTSGNRELYVDAARADNSGYDTITVSFSIDVKPPVVEPPKPPEFVPFSLYGTDTPTTRTFVYTLVKPANAINDATVSITVFDPDFADEGELIINGRPPIKLFGGKGTNANDSKTVTIVFGTPLDYWNDGENLITFNRLRTAGYKVDAMTVSFEVPEVVEPPKPPVFTGANLYGTDTPASQTFRFITNKPATVINDATVSITVFDPDFADEGELIINGKPPIKLFGGKGTNANDSKTVTITFATPTGYWTDGENLITFNRLRTAGYRIEDMTVAFEVQAPIEPFSMFVPYVPATHTLTYTVIKPDDATTGMVTLSVYDPNFPDEGELIINSNAPIKLFGAEGVSSNTGETVQIEINTPASYWIDGDNTITINRVKTEGFNVDSITVIFK